jgi:valyl-tRNA synthetase
MAQKISKKACIKKRIGLAMTQIDLDKNFNRQAIEQKWTKLWLDNKLFVAGLGADHDKLPYVIMMPPPNVTGVLHNGHALFVTLQDILARFWRMKGRDVLWLPGTDHAGIATQTVVERELKKKENKNRHELGREAFLERVFAWKDKHGSHIVEQLKLMGASADWSREHFTMDDQCSYAVRTAFVKLWNDGLIYRKERLVSWDPATKTALSNEEVDHAERNGELFYFAYKVKNNTAQEIIVATTRPETMLGDTAVAVNPKDERYQSLIGCELVHPFIATRNLRVIADDYVDKEFGSGAVKITPAHDPNDFLMGQRHSLEFINIFDLDAKINNNGGEFEKLDRFAARKLIKEKLTNLGLFRKSEQITHAVSVSQRSGVDIEPMLSRQYFVDAKALAVKALAAVDSGDLRIIPSSFKKIWDHFLHNIQDWCISRQLWWGHRIPVYYNIAKLKQAILALGPSACYDALTNEQSLSQVLKLALEELSEESIRDISESFVDEPADPTNYIQEEDVLDTWFSSGLWPFSTLGWPHKTPDLERYYPGTVLETGSDILFFWVARMVMFGIYFMGKPPFKDVFLHAMVRDAHGRKMSKSLGNAVDPIDIIEGITLKDLIEKTKTYPVPAQLFPKVIEGIKKDFPEGIPSAGADGLRLSLAMFSGQGRDVKFSVPRVVGYRAFLNKVWNATRFSLMNIPDNHVVPLGEVLSRLRLADQAIISVLNKTIKSVDNFIQEYRFNEAADTIYHFFWSEYCDKYIEYAKVSFRHDNIEDQKITHSVLIYLLDESMRMLHPFCPFISEEIWQILPIKRDNLSFCARAPFPVANQALINNEAEAVINLVFSVCSMINNGRQSSDLPANLAVPVLLFADNDKTKLILEQNRDLITHMAKTKSIEIFLRNTHEVSDLSVMNASPEVDIVILLAGLIDVDKELNRLSQALQKVSQQKLSLQQRLLNEAFVNNAPAQVVETHKAELSALTAKEEQLMLGKERLLNAKNRV